MTTHFNTVIIGGGLSGLTVAHKLRLADPDHRFLILEKSSTTGGVIRTHVDEGYITEIGPHGFLDNCQESKDILAETGLDQETVQAPLSEFVRYVYTGGKLQCIPQTPAKIAVAPLMKFSEKLRVLAEAWQPPLSGEPTVAKWARHRFGSAMLPFADAVFTGTYAGDFDRLSIDAVMPGVRAMEKEHGSVIRGVLARMSAKRKEKSKKKMAMPAMTSFPEGMCRLPERLTENLIQGEELLLNCAATSISKGENGWHIQTAGAYYTADNLVLAVPINTSLKLLRSIDTSMPMTRVPEAWIATAVFGFGPGTSLPPGFGFLTPESEKRFTLGSLFSSNMFPGRAPDGHIVFETLIGGRRHPERLQLEKEEILARALADVQEILGIQASPSYSTFFQSTGGIPQLEQGYSALLDWRDQLMADSPGLHICGFGWEGIGLNDMMKTATRVAQAIDEATASVTAEAEPKKVYF